MLGLSQQKNWEWFMYPSFAQLWTDHSQAARILIDIPIGLPVDGPRRCDVLARKVLTRLRSSSVFPIPCREALQAKTYLEGCAENLAALGVKISKQTWNIREKILEVDQWLQGHPSQHTTVLECHPEVAFWAWNAQQPMAHGKKTNEGQAIRKDLLEKHLPEAADIFQAAIKTFPRKQVLADDILDAMVLCLSATMPCIQSLPEKPSLDALGLPMQIVYPAMSSDPC